ncbi:MAG: transcription-repair coupling factor [Gammaproteobacteria bacterium GWE2_37_16]|nr:MAG: transcription-repair coupling factor [Gammaproteobacteria bacterium GWE2_37_16]
MNPINLLQLYNKLPEKKGQKIDWSGLHGAETGFVISNTIQTNQHPTLIITKDITTANRLKTELEFFRSPLESYPIYIFPDWETLPYDQFSPHEDIISDRLLTLYRLPKLNKGAVIVAAKTLMNYLPPCSYLLSNSFALQIGEQLNSITFRQNIEKYGYHRVEQVMEHGEFAIRGSIIDIFPTGSPTPYRIDLFDEVVDSIRSFDTETQISERKVDKVQFLPAKEFPLTKEDIRHFRQSWYTFFSGDPSNCSIYQSVSSGNSAAGIEYFLRLFFDQLDTLFDYLPENSLIVTLEDINAATTNFNEEVKHRYDQLRYDQHHPILPPTEIFLTVDKFFGFLKSFARINIEEPTTISKLPDLAVNYKANKPLANLSSFIENTAARVLICAESLGRRESILQLLNNNHLNPSIHTTWTDFCKSKDKFGIIVSPLEQSALLQLTNQEIALITETQLFSIQTPSSSVAGTRRPRQDLDAIVRNLTELHVGDPIVHIEHGVGRYLGLQKINAGNEENEFLTIEYANKTKLYVPVTSLHLISRYSGSPAENAPLTHLGAKQWEKAKQETIKKVRDVAVELLNIYAKRAAKVGHIFAKPGADYLKFAAGFPFVETEDQKNAIAATITDMTSERLMDRLICGDVGFGKTEVAMRATFVAISSNKQVAILAPTTLLAEQHYHNFCNRFADWPVQIAMLSRFCSSKEQATIIEKLKDGKVDIVIGTHKLLQPKIIFRDLGLLIIDEEHRFGVKQKESIKKLRPEIDTLTLTATPIPRTLNMALSGMRDFSIIATPPPGRLAIRTFIRERNNHLIREAILREVLRGGQVYFLHNNVTTIKRTVEELEKLVPQAKIAFAHGQMQERELERIMSDFYHRRFNVLVCSTIIESGIDIPTANTIIIDRADRLGLAQLHQLRGRVGRSHHQAYAYFLVPQEEAMTPDAKKRLDAIGSMGDLGVGFVLASHDLEIRGTGEILGEEQSGQIAAVGFDLYLEYLERAVTALKEGKQDELDKDPLQQVTEIDLKVPTLLPDDYIADINARLILYKRIAAAKNQKELDMLQVEMIDRFGLLPEAAKNLFSSTEIKLLAEPLGIKKIIANLQQGTIEFTAKPNVDAKKVIALVQKHSNVFKLKGGSRLEFTKKHEKVEGLVKFLKIILQEVKL